MKSGLKYLLLLGLFLFKGYDYSFAAMHSSSFKQAAVHDTQSKNISCCNDQQELVCFLLDNLLNDDDDPISIKGKTSIRNYASIFGNTFFLNPPSLLKNNSQLHKSYYYLSSDKYIFQRVFRV